MTESTETTVTQTVEPSDRIGALARMVEVAVKFELHAFIVLFAGVVLTVQGHKDEGMLVLGGALGILKGGK